jgi:hypothetical protein
MDAACRIPHPTSTELEGRVGEDCIVAGKLVSAERASGEGQIAPTSTICSSFKLN